MHGVNPISDPETFMDFTGYCPESLLQGKQVRMRLNTNDFFESEATGLQIAIPYPGVQAVIMSFRGEGKFREKAQYAEDNGERFSPQTTNSFPFCHLDLLQSAGEVKNYIDTIKS
ncbi:MAG: hypothetical protein EOP48_03245 [Sphingobacteriales bacterium]|nr:MAG: hypothetical protein EOP48_03245 [Sphingobacteriales bacterium]